MPVLHSAFNPPVIRRTERPSLPSFNVNDDQENDSAVGKGRVLFNVANINIAVTQDEQPDIAHTLWVIKTELHPGELPLKGPGLGIDVSDVDVWAAVPAMNSGEENTLNLNLVAGS